MAGILHSIGHKLHPVGPLNTVNYALNPAMTVGDTTLTYNGRVNLSPNPSAESNLNGWTAGWFGPGGTGTTSQVAGAGIGNGYSVRKTWTVASSNSNDTGFSQTVSVTPGLAYTVSGYINPSSANYGLCHIVWKDGSNATISDTIVDIFTPLPAGIWTRVSQVNQIAPANAVTGVFIVTTYGSSSGMSVGQTVDYDQILIEQSTTLGSYFDGSYDGAISRTNLCTNPSFETGTTGWSTSGATIATTTSARLFGTQCALVNWTGGAGNTSFTFNTTSGQLYAVSAYVKIPTGNPAAQLSIAGIVGSAQTSTVVGDWQRLSYVFTASASSHQLQISNATSVTGQCYLDGVLIEAVPNVGDYFDGSMPPMRGTTQQWTGTPGGSTSTQYIPNGIIAWNSTPNNSTSTHYDIGPKWWVASNAILTRDSTVTWQGQYCAKMMPSLTSAIPKMQQTFTVQDSTNYSVSFDVFLPVTNTGGGISVEFDCYDINNTLIVQNTTPLLVSGSPTNGFIRLATTFAMPAGTNTVTVSVRPPNQPTALTDVIYIDSFLFEQADTASANYVDGDCAGYCWSGTAGESTTLKTSLPGTLDFFATSAYYPPTSVPTGNVAMGGAAQVLPTSWPAVPLTD